MHVPSPWRFDAFVLGVPAESEGQQEGIAEQQERAEAAGYGPLAADVFEACGSG